MDGDRLMKTAVMFKRFNGFHLTLVKVALKGFSVYTIGFDYGQKQFREIVSKYSVFSN